MTGSGIRPLAKPVRTLNIHPRSYLVVNCIAFIVIGLASATVLILENISAIGFVDDSRVYGLVFCLISLGSLVSTYRNLVEPYQVHQLGDGRFTFVSILSSVTVELGAVSKIHIEGKWDEDESHGPAIVIRHSGGRLVVPVCKDTIELVIALKEANPLAFITGMPAEYTLAAPRRWWISAGLSIIGFGVGYFYMGRPGRAAVAAACIVFLAAYYLRHIPTSVDELARSLVFAGLGATGIVIIVLDAISLGRQQPKMTLRWYNS